MSKTPDLEQFTANAKTYLTPSVKEALETLAKERRPRVPFAHILREAAEEYLEKRGRLPKQG